MQEVTSKEELNTVLSSNDKVLVDFWAPWCGPCRMIADIIAEIDTDNNGIVVVKVNIDEAEDLARSYEIRSIPTVIAFKNGVTVNKQIGATNKDNYLAMFGE